MDDEDQRCGLVRFRFPEIEYLPRMITVPHLAVRWRRHGRVVRGSSGWSLGPSLPLGLCMGGKREDDKGCESESSRFHGKPWWRTSRQMARPRSQDSEAEMGERSYSITAHLFVQLCCQFRDRS